MTQHFDDYAPQQSGQWFQARIGKLTASSMGMAMDFLKNGAPSQKRKDLMADIVGERMTDELRATYVTPAMQWGNEKEPFAKAAYEARTGLTIQDAGFVEHPTIENFGASPDGFLSDDGLIEIKCPSTTTFIAWKLAGVVPEQHKPQMLAQLACTGRKWCEFVAFDPRVKVGMQLFIRRFEPTAEEIKEVETAAIQFLKEVEEMFEAACEAA